EQGAKREEQGAGSEWRRTEDGGRRTEDGARRSRRFTVRRLRKLEMAGLLSFRALKRRERRAPHSARSCHPLARDSILLAVSPDAVKSASPFDVRLAPCSLLHALCPLPFALCLGGSTFNVRCSMFDVRLAPCSLLPALCPLR